MLQSFTIVFKQSMLLAISSRLVASQHLQKQSSFVARNECLRRNVPHCREHGNSAVLEFRLTTTLEVLHATVRGKSSRIPKSDWLLNTKLVLERTQRRVSVVGPISPGASGQAVLRQQNSYQHPWWQTTATVGQDKVNI